MAHYAEGHPRELCERLRAWLGARSLRQVARSTGFNHESVRRWFRGESSIPSEFLIALARKHNLSVTWLLLGRGGPDATERSNTPLALASTSDLLAELAHRAREAEDAAAQSATSAGSRPTNRATVIKPADAKPGA